MKSNFKPAIPICRFAWAALAILFASSIGSSSDAQEINWHPNVDSAVQEATTQNKLVMMHFGADWCRPCRNLETFVFSNPIVQREFRDNVSAVKIDADSEKALVQEYGVSKLPFDIMMTPQGRVVMKRSSPANASSYAKMMRDLNGIIGDLADGEDPALQQSLAEIKDQFKVATPRLEGQPVSFTPQRPSHTRPQPSVESLKLKRRNVVAQRVTNPFAPVASVSHTRVEPEKVENTLAPMVKKASQELELSQELEISQASPSDQFQVPQNSPSNQFMLPQSSAQSSSPSDSNFLPPEVPSSFGTSAKTRNTNSTAGQLSFQPNVVPEPPQQLVLPKAKAQTSIAEILIPQTPRAEVATPPSNTVEASKNLNLDTQFSNQQVVSQPATESQISKPQASNQPIVPRDLALKRLEQSDVAARLIREKAEKKRREFDAKARIVMDDKFYGQTSPQQVALSGNYRAKINLPDEVAAPGNHSNDSPTNYHTNQQLVQKRASQMPTMQVGSNSRSQTSYSNSPIENGLAQAASKPTKTQYALHGKCPVTLLTKGKWANGDEQWGCIHRNRIYIFSSESHLQLFQHDPDGYSPVLAGYDPVLFRETGKLVNGREQHGVFMGKSPQQRVVLFANAETRARFQSNPKQYLESVREAMRRSGDASPQFMR